MRAVATAQHVRKPFWFERFNWFITSEKCARAWLAQSHMRVIDILVIMQLTVRSWSINMRRGG